MHVIESFKEEWTHVHPIKPLDDKEHYMRITKKSLVWEQKKKEKEIHEYGYCYKFWSGKVRVMHSWHIG